MRGLAYPVTTYALVGERAADETAISPVHDNRSNFTLHFDLEQMTDYERKTAVIKLKRALNEMRAAKD